MYAKKSLGQHFLRSEKALSQIIDAGDIKADDIVLEIGPGEGVLTERLLALSGKVIAIEKDRELIPKLTERFAEKIKSGKLILLNEDILKFNPTNYSLLTTNSYKLIANIPYYITGAIFEKFLSSQNQPSIMVVLIQKEVAERIVTRNGKQSILSVAVKVYGEPKIVARVPRGAFAPAPTVDSAILSIENISRDFFTSSAVDEVNLDEDQFFSVLKAVFGKKRAQLGRSLGEYLKNKEKALEIIKSVGLDPKIRPEDMELLDWKNITRCIPPHLL